MISSLFDLSFKRFCESLEDAWLIEYLPLPPSFKRKMRNEIKDLWGCQNALQSVEDYDYSFINLWDMSRTEFNMVMNHPNEVPEFVFENNHVAWDFYLWQGENFIRSVCGRCCTRLYNLSEEQAECFWGMKKISWKYYHSKNHKSYDGAEMLDEIIWDLDNYCDICVTQSLYQIYSEERCRDELSYHYKLNDDSDTSTEEYDHESTTLLQHAPKIVVM